jgi:hypothetical protein
MMKRYWLAIAALIILSPLGLLADGTAWGEWGSDDLSETLGYIPQGMQNVQDVWTGIFPDYSIGFLGESSPGQSIGYIIAAIIGSAMVYGVSLLLTKMIAAKKNPTLSCSNK